MGRIKTDEEWEAENDARTLAESINIMNDPTRLNTAKGAAERLAREKEAEVNGLKNIATGATPEQALKNARLKAFKKG